MTQGNRSPSTTTLETLVSPEIKALWQKAAEIEGRTLTDFVIASVQEAACKVISQHQTLKLNREDSEAFVDALLNPPEANDTLKAAALRYKQVMCDGGTSETGFLC